MKHTIDALTLESLANIVKLFYSNKVVPKFALLSLRLIFEGPILLENRVNSRSGILLPKTGFLQLCTSHISKYENEIFKVNNYIPYLCCMSLSHTRI